MPKRSLVVASLAMTVCGAFSSALVAQDPWPGLPMIDPPVSHPALAAQPLIGSQSRTPASAASPADGPAPKAVPAKPPEPETIGPKLAGKDLKKAIAVVGKLHWYDKLGEARVRAAASGKPILLIQALGDLEGFA